MELRPMVLPNSERAARLQDVIELCPRGLVKQQFTQDDHPKQWNKFSKGRVRIHIINEKHFERETGLKLKPRKKALTPDQSTFIMPDHSRAFVQEPERSKGIPSVAELFKQVSKAKVRAQVSADATSTGRNLQEHTEGQKEERRARWTMGKLARYLFSGARVWVLNKRACVTWHAYRCSIKKLSVII